LDLEENTWQTQPGLVITNLTTINFKGRGALTTKKLALKNHNHPRDKAPLPKR
jgi:hypothetical protein